MNMKDVVNRLIIINNVIFRNVISGSMGEGFCFEEFDLDVMEYLDGF